MVPERSGGPASNCGKDQFASRDRGVGREAGEEKNIGDQKVRQRFQHQQNRDGPGREREVHGYGGNSSEGNYGGGGSAQSAVPDGYGGEARVAAADKADGCDYGIQWREGITHDKDRRQRKHPVDIAPKHAGGSKRGEDDERGSEGVLSRAVDERGK